MSIELNKKQKETHFDRWIKKFLVKFNEFT